VTSAEGTAADDTKQTTGPGGSVMRREDAFVPIPSDLAQSISEFYGLRKDFSVQSLMGRSSGATKVYSVAPVIAAVLGDRLNDRLKLVHTGLRCLEKNDTSRGMVVSCRHRLCEEGLFELLPFVHRQLVVTSSVEDVSLLLNNASVKISSFSDRHLIGQLNQIQLGCAVVILVSDYLTSLPHARPLAVSCWRATSSLGAMASKPERNAILSVLALSKKPPTNPNKMEHS